MRQQRSRRKSEEDIRRKWTVAIRKNADKAEKKKMRSRDPRNGPTGCRGYCMLLTTV
jgi:hypothetical protein